MKIIYTLNCLSCLEHGGSLELRQNLRRIEFCPVIRTTEPKMITLDQAVKRGNAVLFYPLVTAFVGVAILVVAVLIFLSTDSHYSLSDVLPERSPNTGGGLFYYLFSIRALAEVLSILGIMALLTVLLFCPILIVLMPYMWLVTIRWRIWAFTNIADKDVSELKRMAMAKNWIGRDGVVFKEKEFMTRLLTKKQRTQIHELESRFSTPEIVEAVKSTNNPDLDLKDIEIANEINDDTSIPATTEIHYSKKIIIRITLAGVALTVFSNITLNYLSDEYSYHQGEKLALIGIIFGVFIFVVGIKRMLKWNRSYAALNEESITIAGKQYPWTAISKIKQRGDVEKGFLKAGFVILQRFEGENIKIGPFQDLDITVKDLEHRISIYIMRARLRESTIPESVAPK